VKTPGFGRKKSAGRILDYAAFFAGTFLHLLMRKRPDLVVSLTTPPLLASVVAVIHKLRGHPYAIWSMDLHPDAEKALGMLADGQPLTRLLDGINDFAYRNAAMVVDLGRHMQDRILAKGVDTANVATIPVWGNDPAPVPKEENPLIEEWGLSGKTVVLYAGNAGLVHSFDEIVAAMEALEGVPDLAFLFVGGGPRREEVLRETRARGIENFQYRGYVPMEVLPSVLSLGDVHLVSLRPAMAGIAVPSKLYDSMAMARPVVMVGPAESDSADTIRTAGAGFVIDPTASGAEAPERIAEAIQRLCSDPSLRRIMGEGGRRLYETEYRREVLCQRWGALLRARLGDSKP
jgi:glycosyltransferase involved in cell wall biosynthesis